MNEHINFAFFDEGSKREIRRATLKAVAIPGYQADRALEYFNEGRHTDGEYCTMCGPNFCAMKLSRDLKAINNE